MIVLHHASPKSKQLDVCSCYTHTASISEICKPSETSCISQRQPLSHLAVITGLEELWKQLADAKETNGFLELPESISNVFPKASPGKLLVRDAYKTLLRVFERRSGVTLVQPEYYASIASQSEETSPSPAKKQKTGKLSFPKCSESSVHSKHFPIRSYLQICTVFCNFY